jgi:hypothetical protein
MDIGLELRNVLPATKLTSLWEAGSSEFLGGIGTPAFFVTFSLLEEARATHFALKSSDAIEKRN